MGKQVVYPFEMPPSCQSWRLPGPYRYNGLRG